MIKKEKIKLILNIIIMILELITLVMYLYKLIIVNKQEATE